MCLQVNRTRILDDVDDDGCDDEDDDDDDVDDDGCDDDDVDVVCWYTSMPLVISVIRN